MAEPPLSTGAVHTSPDWPLPAVAVTAGGGPGRGTLGTARSVGSPDGGPKALLLFPALSLSGNSVAIHVPGAACAGMTTVRCHVPSAEVPDASVMEPKPAVWDVD